MNKKSILTAGTLALAISTASSGVYSAELEEIIVTAQKRAESLQDVPISMSALSGSSVKDNGIHSFQDLSGYVPNLSIQENAVNSIITMRGIGIGSNQSFEQSVGIYVDGVHFGKSRQVRTGLFDIEQLEVLRGPQGILFGKNTLAGAINVTTASADVGDDTSGRLDVTQESFNGQIVDAHIQGSVTDNLAVRFALRDRTRDGHLKNTMPGASTDTMATTDEQMWRLSATFEPSDDVVIKAKHTQSDYLRVGSNAIVTTFQPEANIAASNSLMYAVMGTFFPQTAQLAAAGHPSDAYRDSISIGGLALAQSLGRDLDSTEEQLEGTDTQTADTSLTIERTMSNGNTFTSVTGLTSYEYDDGIDADFLPVQFIGRSDISEYESLSQEFRLSSPVDAEFSYITGAYLQSSKQEIDRLVAIDGTLGQPGFMTLATGCRSFLAIPGGGCIDGVTAFDVLGRVSRWEQDTNAWAVFFQGTYDIADNLSLTAGFRYTKEEKSAHAKTDLTQSNTGLANPNPNPYAAAIQAASFGSWAHEFKEDRSTNQFMPAMNLQWEASETSNYYVSYSEGFKSGGFNAVDDQNPEFLADGTVLRTVPGPGFEYDDETASSFEIGGKHILMDGAMSFNWAYFDSEYLDQQVSTFVGLGFVVANAATSDVSGLEVDMKVQASENLRLSANFAVLDATYGEFDSAGCTARQASDLLGALAQGLTSASGCDAQFTAAGQQSGSSQDISGGQQGATYSGTLSADYSALLDNGLSWYVSADLYFTDWFFMAGDLDPIDKQDSFERLGMRAGIQGEKWDIMLYGSNITDETFSTGAFDVPLAAGTHARYTAPGAIWGVRLGYDF
tara:strand:+ start:1 stop:2529 length:2529 start_codon:yes stop_codon:yes gene_type:complete